ncbi:hypothetical protein [Streptomyces sp. PR69]|uniref:hypothetical protein n=1 Tax=Streptomyces sp. PR69 TaxID=2984950 RepID=UPI002263D70D|nr:hypothetical protein [Streptomyces sp. PR69]
MVYPDILAGRRITAALLRSMIPMEVYKPSNTDRASTTTLADDPDLTVELEGNATYRVEFWLHFAAINLDGGSPAGRFKTNWRVPSGATFLRGALGPDQGQSLSGTAGGQGRWGVHASGTDVTYGSRDSSTNQCIAIEDGIVFTSSAGTLALQWAQQVSYSGATRLGSGSYMKVRRIA